MTALRSNRVILLPIITLFDSTMVSVEKYSNTVDTQLVPLVDIMVNKVEEMIQYTRRA